MRTVREHLQSIPDPYGKQALYNCRHGIIQSQKVAKCGYALYIAFDWSESPEGSDYWGRVWKAITKRETI